VGGWGELAAAFAAFRALHALPVRPAVRRPLVAVLLGEGGYLGAYSAASVAVLAWLIVAAGRAPCVAIWPYAAWQAGSPTS
jgi:uncharacterized membrane protein